MNLFEYQARGLLGRYGLPIPPGDVATRPEEARQIAEGLSKGPFVVKAQILAGGRGKGHFRSGFAGGVHLCSYPAEVEEVARAMLGGVLVTAQTGPEGRPVNKVLVAEAPQISRELYLAILIDRGRRRSVVVGSAQGGVDIEEVARESPGEIHRIWVDPQVGFWPYQARTLAACMGLCGSLLPQTADLIVRLYRFFCECDASLAEINPLAVIENEKIAVIDAKIGLDENALFRHPEVATYRNEVVEDGREAEALKAGLNYVGLSGEIGCMVNGAGLAMATMDILHRYGGEPANFLDVGGGADQNQVTKAFGILMADPKVRAIFVHIFGGIMRCDVIARGIVEAVTHTKPKVPIVVRLQGTNFEEGKAILHQSGLPIRTADDLADAAQKAVAAAAETR
ncbi:ADP-forming succinate--CoA ligase subunit beta [Methylacidimicrobium tartarophylax]|uniref:Succinate--CoA ligase [ADP-forming] subunit beta n=1 Tax=Methylacidimicrobium tartarophylax TaxID=1041768 RepID=A0A5E6ME76_9BACT|nr:ADP-forming succinate--CoA ligase subunit beta [Methylacidimicrobium tartarophylax]VVM07404.1 succinyl-CoA synthetase beta subunit [Methylacidimicrobium tartarophylax]